MDNATPTPAQLRDLLVVLKDAGVTRFRCAAFEVELPVEAPAKEVFVRPAPTANKIEPTPKQGYSALFGGVPPAFKPSVAE